MAQLNDKKQCHDQYDKITGTKTKQILLLLYERCQRLQANSKIKNKKKENAGLLL